MRRLTNPSNSSNYVDVKCIDNITFTIPEEQYQDYLYNFDNTSDNTDRQVHPVTITGSDGISKLQVERIDVLSALNLAEQNWEWDHNIIGNAPNSDGPDGSDLPVHLKTFDVTLYHVNPDGSRDTNQWVKIQRVQEMYVNVPAEQFQDKQFNLNWPDMTGEDDMTNPSRLYTASDGTSINPPWRLDMFQNIIDVHWGGGYYVLITLKIPHVTGNFAQSSPSGSILSYAVDPVNGTECDMVSSITNLFPGANVVYQNVNLTVTPNVVYYAYLPDSISPNFLVTFNSFVGGGTSPPPFDNAADTEAWLISNQDPDTVGPFSGNTFITGYHSTLTARAMGAQNGSTPYTATTLAEYLAWINTGPTSVPPPPGISSNSGLEVAGSAQFINSGNKFDVSVLYLPIDGTTGTFYDADYTATYVIQLPFSSITPTPTPEIPAFAITTTGYPWNADISVYPANGIIVDPTNPSFPLKWKTGSPPLGPDGNPWAPFGSPDTNVEDASVWEMFYEDTVGTATDTNYPFAVVVSDHLTADPAPDPMLSNPIVQLYPTFVSSIVVDGEGSDWYVEGYSDVAYGTQFQAPDEWGASTSLTTPGPLPLISTDVPA